MHKRILFFVLVILIVPSTAYFRTSNDVLIAEQNYLTRVNAFNAWDHTTGSRSVVVAVVDTGVDIDHPDLTKNIWVNTGEIAGDGIDNDANGYVDDVNGWDFITKSADPRPKIGSGYNAGAVTHGTLVAGVIGAEGNNGQGIAGINWQVSLMPLRVLDHQGNGNSRIVRDALRYAMDNGADVINFSFVGTSFDGQLADLILEAESRGIAVVSAAGNEGDEHIVSDLDLFPHYPVCHPGNVGVAGVDDEDKKAPFSNYGFTCIDVSAPGKQIMTTSYFNPAVEDFRNFYTNSWSGTSFSAPIVSGAIALLKSISPERSPTALASIIIESADGIDDINPLYAGELGSGRINIARALEVLSESGPLPKNVVQRRILLPRVSTLTAVTGGSRYATWSKSGDSQISQDLPFSFANEPMAVIDIDNDRVLEIVVGSTAGSEPYVTIYNTVTGEQENQFLAYDATFRGGVRIYVSDVDNNGFQDIITVPASAGRGHVRVFDSSGNAFADFVSNDAAVNSGYTVSAIGVPSGGQHILLNRTGTDLILRYTLTGELISAFFTGHQTPENGLFIVTGDVTGDTAPEVIVSARRGSPQVLVLTQSGETISSFMAYAEKFRGGVSIGIVDATGDGTNNIITGAGATGGPHVRTFNLRGELLGQFFAGSEQYSAGVIIAH